MLTRRLNNKKIIDKLEFSDYSKSTKKAFSFLTKSIGGVFMLKLYSNYWRNTFNYKDSSNFKEFMYTILCNSFVLMSIYLIGVFGPVSLENVIVNLFYFILLIMIFPTVSLLIRVLKS